MLRGGSVAGGARGGQAAGVRQQFNEDLLPELAVAEQAQIGERLLRGAQLALALAELVGEGDEQATQPLPLILRERQDTRHVVALGRLLLLAEVPDQVAAVLVARHHAVEQERVHVVVERLVVQEELRQQAQVAAPRALPPPVDLEEADEVVAVDFISWWVAKLAFRPVSLVCFLAAEVRQAKFVDVHEVQICEFLWVRREVPGFDDVFAHLDLLEIAHQV